MQQLRHLFRKSNHLYANDVESLSVWHIPALYSLFLHMYHSFLKPTFEKVSRLFSFTLVLRHSAS